MRASEIRETFLRFFETRGHRRIASASLVQHLGGAVTERLATSAADALYAAYRMARLGIIVMDLCRPIPFQEGDIPSVASLVGNVLRRGSQSQSR